MGLADFQNEIYLAGLGDVCPSLPTDLTQLESLAAQHLSAQAYGYVAGAAGTESTARANRAAFEKWHLVPRMLRDVSNSDLSVTMRHALRCLMAELELTLALSSLTSPRDLTRDVLAV